MGNKQRWYNRILMKILSSCLLIIFIMLSGLNIAQAKQTINVAYFNLGKYFFEDSNGGIDSYDTELLRYIEPYTDLKFEFVNCDSWEKALAQLGKDNIDLIGTAQRTPARAAKYAFGRESYGYTIGQLATLAEKEIVYQDYDAIGKSIIGCTQQYVRRPELDRLFKEHNIAPKILTYPNEAALEKALTTGEVDIIAANSHVIKDEWKLVDNFSYSSMYFITWKGNEQLVDELDRAIIRINLEKPFLLARLNQKYFPRSTLVPLNKKEVNLVRQQDSYNIYLEKKLRPLVWWDKTDLVMKGALVEAMTQMGKFTGLQFQLQPKSKKQRLQSSREIYYTLLLPDFNGKWVRDEGFTDAIMEEPFNLFQRSNESYNLDQGQYTIAILEGSDEMKSYLMERFVNCQIIACTTPEECLRKLVDKEADFTFLNIQVCNAILLEAGIEGIRETPIRPVNIGIGLRFLGTQKALLASVVNKSIAYLDQAKIAQVMLQASLDVTPKITLSRLLRTHPLLMSVLAIIGIILLLSIAVVLTYARVMRKERDKVRQANKDRSDFFARVSHDMRTPMNGILGMAYLSEQENDAVTLRSNMAKVKDSGIYLLGLINDSLDLQKIEIGNLQLEKQTVKGKQLVDSVVNMVKLSAEKKQIDFRVTRINTSYECYIKCDPQRVRQIFVNLLSNAVKYTPQGGKIQLVIERIGIENNVIHEKIKVIDTGIGISKDFLQHKLFTPYAREINAESDKYGGSGLGLSIAKKLVELMGGRIEVTSELGEGTTFTVYLDWEKVDAKQVKQEAEEKNKRVAGNIEHLQGKTILLCEDHPINAEITKKLLEKVGCKVVVAKDGKQGVEDFSGSALHEFMAVLMDIRMPVMDGIEAAKKIRTLQRADAGTIPIIALSANAYKEDVEKSIAAGMNAHIAKPIEPEVLYNTLLDFLN